MEVPILVRCLPVADGSTRGPRSASAAAVTNPVALASESDGRAEISLFLVWKREIGSLQERNFLVR